MCPECLLPIAQQALTMVPPAGAVAVLVVTFVRRQTHAIDQPEGEERDEANNRVTR
jgi:hypothetical protein